MNIEIDEEAIKEQITIEAKKIVSSVVGMMLRGWGFEDKVKEIVRKEMDSVIQEVVAKELGELASIQQIVRVQMVKRCREQLNKAIKLSEVVE